MMARVKHKPETVEKMRKALELRRGGATYPQIAELMGCAVSGAFQMVQDALRETLQEPADEVRHIELERLDLMLRALLPRALNQDDKGQARCAEMVLKLMDRRAAYLGLDAPVRKILEVVTQEHLEEAIANFRRELAEYEAAGADS